MRDPYLPDFAKNEALFTYWNNQIQKLKTPATADTLAIPLSPLGNPVSPLRVISLPPQEVLAVLPAEVQAQVRPVVQKLEGRVRVILDKIRDTDRRDLTLADQGVLNVLLPWLVAYLAQEGLQVQVCYNGKTLFLRLDHVGPHPLNNRLAARMWQDFQTSIIFYAGSTTFWADKAKFIALKGKAILLPLALVVHPSWHSGVIRALQKAKRFTVDRLIDSPFNGCAIGIGLGQKTVKEDPVFYLNNVLNFHYDFRYFWRSFRVAWQHEDVGAVTSFLRSALREVQKINSVGQGLVLNYVKLWRGLMQKLPANMIKADLTPHGHLATQVRLLVPLHDALQVVPEVLGPHCTGYIRPTKTISLRLILDGQKVAATETDSAVIFAAINEQLARSDQYFQARLPIVAQAEVFLSSLRDALRQLDEKKQREFIRTEKNNPLYQSLFALISE